VGKGAGTLAAMATKRTTTAVVAAGSARGKPPTFPEWMATQITNTEAARAEAAAHISGRWALTSWYSHDKVLRALEKEGSEHLHGARLLGADYAEQFKLSAVAAHQNGATILPFAPPGERCAEPKANGSLCMREAVPGAGRCGRHGGTWLTEDERRATAEAVTDQILEASAAALRVLTELLDNGVSEKVRLDAALAILDRSKPPSTTKIELEITQQGAQAAAEIEARLVALAENLAAADEVVIEAEASDAPGV
jgi:hypothetical protein